MQPTAGKRILMLLENATFPMDGRVRREAQTLLGAGCEVSIICPAATGQPSREILHGVHVYRYQGRFSGGGAMGYVWEYSWALVMTFLLSLLVWWRRDFDVIHSHNPPDFFVLIALFYKPFRKKFVFDHHDLSPEMYYARFGGGNALVFRVLVFFEKLTCRVADHVIATNDSYKTLEMQRSGIPAERITVVRNGPELSRVRITTPDAELRAKASTIIGYVGMMGFQDGLDYLVRALKHLRYDLGRTDFYCVAVGMGDALESLRELTIKLQLQDHLNFTGFVSDTDLMRYLSTADIMVDPDPSNPFTDRSTMIKMMEYMTLGKPIVAFDLPEHRVTAEDSALYARANDEREFAEQLVVLMDDPQRREAMGRRGRQRIETYLNWNLQEQCLLDAYGKLFATRHSKVAAAKEVAIKHAAAEQCEPVTS